MKSPADFATFCIRRATLFLLVFAAPFAGTQQIESAPAQQVPSNGGFGIIDDWTSHHVVFSNPGPLMDAMMNGHRPQWELIVNDPRYRMQEVRRSGVTIADSVVGPSPQLTDREAQPVFDKLGENRFRRKKKDQTLEGAWSVSFNAGTTALDMYPAKYTFSPIGNPNCTDFVVFPINAAGTHFSQSNIFGINHLYVTTCTGVPTTQFDYFVGTTTSPNGAVLTSPALSLNGTKIAFVESVSGGSKFHVLTIGTTGTNTGARAPCTVNGATNPLCTSNGYTNNAVDNNIVMSGAVMVTRSSPFVDYAHDVAYVGDDTGKLHKFTGVFLGTPAEAGSPWPVTVSSGIVLSPPTYDNVSGNIFVGGSGGKLWCVVSSTGLPCSTPSVTIGTGPVLDGPIVDSTTGEVFAAANTASNAVLSQVTTSMGSQVTATMGAAGTDLYDGAFDNAYFTSVGTGHMYFCGNLTGAATPTLWRVTFNSSGVMSGSNDGMSAQLVVSGNTGTNDDCTPITEVFNSAQGHDYLFVGVKNVGLPSGCSSSGCIMSFDVQSATPFTVLSAASIGGGSGTSGMAIDNVSTTTGGSQLYFGSLINSTGNQLSQSALK